MPVARKYGQQQISPSAQPDAQITPAFTPESQGAGLALAQARVWEAGAEAADRATSTLIGIDRLHLQAMAEEREKAKTFADNMAVLDGTNQINAWQRGFIYDPETGVLSTRGKNSFETPELADAEFEKQASVVMEKMTNPEQQLAMKRIVVGMRDEIGTVTRRHVDREMKSYAASELTKGLENSLELAVSAALTKDSEGNLDLPRARLHMAAAMEQLDKVGPEIGLGPETITDMKGEFKSQMHQGIISQLNAEGQTSTARAYFAATKDEINHEVEQKLTDELKEGDVRKRSQQEAARILKTGATPEQQREMAKQIDDADVQDETLKRLEHEHALQERTNDNAKKELRRGIAEQLDKVPNTDAIPPAQWAQLSDSERSAFYSYVDQVIRNGDVKEDRRVWYAHIIAAGKNPTKWARETDLTHDIHRLSKNSYKDLAELQSALLRGDAMADKAITSTMTHAQVVSDVLVGAGLDPTPKTPGTAEAKAVVTFRSAVDQAVNAKQSAEGRKLSTDEVRQIANDMISEVILREGSWLGAFTSAPFKDEVKRVSELTINDMTEVEKKQATEYLQKHQTPVTPEAMLDAFRRLKLLESQTKKAR